jgi:hypothetical protein
MNFDSCEEAGKLRDDARQQRHVRAVEFVGYPMQQYRVKPRVAEKNLKDALGRRVLAEYRVDLFPD